jgi:hypothetical protein
MMTMDGIEGQGNLLFRDEKAGTNLPSGLPVFGDATEKIPWNGHAYYLCAQCKGIITPRADEIFVNGAHSHTFANPMGMVFAIACFKHADGCMVAGPPSNEFSWFSGYSWKIAYCRYCGMHNGWQFIHGPGDGFFGLIKDRLVLSKP